MLEGHVIKNISIGMYASCKHLCTIESHCVSFNLGPPIMDRMVCELSDSDVTKHPGDLKPREGFVYRGTEVRYCSSLSANAIRVVIKGGTASGKVCYSFVLFAVRMHASVILARTTQLV